MTLSWTNCNNNRMNSWTNCNNNTSKNEVWSADDCWRYELVKNEARRMTDEARSTLCSEVKWNEVKWSYVILDELACMMSNLKPWYELFQLQPDLNETNQRCFKHPTFLTTFSLRWCEVNPDSVVVTFGAWKWFSNAEVLTMKKLCSWWCCDNPRLEPPWSYLKWSPRVGVTKNEVPSRWGCEWKMKSSGVEVEIIAFSPGVGLDKPVVCF